MIATVTSDEMSGVQIEVSGTLFHRLFGSKEVIMPKSKRRSAKPIVKPQHAQQLEVRPLGMIVLFGPQNESEQRRLKLYNHRKDCFYQDYFPRCNLDRAQLAHLVHCSIRRLRLIEGDFRHAIMRQGAADANRILSRIAADVRQMMANRPRRSILSNVPPSPTDAHILGKIKRCGGRISDHKRRLSIDLRAVDSVGHLVELVSLITAALPTVASLDLSGTDADDGVIRRVSTLSQLDTLKVSDTAITNRALESLAKLKCLVNLDLARTKITDEGLPSLKALTNLRHLTLPRTISIDARFDLRRNLPKVGWISNV